MSTKNIILFLEGGMIISISYLFGTKEVRAPISHIFGKGSIVGLRKKISKFYMPYNLAWSKKNMYNFKVLILIIHMSFVNQIMIIYLEPSQIDETFKCLKYI